MKKIITQIIPGLTIFLIVSSSLVNMFALWPNTSDFLGMTSFYYVDQFHWDLNRFNSGLFELGNVLTILPLFLILTVSVFTITMRKKLSISRMRLIAILLMVLFFSRPTIWMLLIFADAYWYSYWLDEIIFENFANFSWGIYFADLELSLAFAPTRFFLLLVLVSNLVLVILFGQRDESKTAHKLAAAEKREAKKAQREAARALRAEQAEQKAAVEAQRRMQAQQAHMQAMAQQAQMQAQAQQAQMQAQAQYQSQPHFQQPTYQQRFSTQPAYQQPQQPQFVQPPVQQSMISELAELERMRDSGALTPEEFTAAKKRVLGQ